MKPLDFPLLADENIHPDVISYLRQQECDVRSVVIDAQALDLQPLFILVAEQKDRTVQIRTRQL